MTLASPPVRISSGSPNTRFLQRIFSFPVALAGLLAVPVMLTVRARFDDPDMWWHLKMGEIIWKTHTIPLHDIFSYTTGHQALIPQEWLSELFIYAAYHWGGYSGLMLWLCIFSCALVLAGYVLCSIYSGNLKVAFVGAMIVWLFATVGFAIRPHLIGYLLLIVELLLIHLGRARHPRWFLGLPILFALWINCHASFILGLILAGLFLFTSFFNFRLGSLVAQPWPLRSRKLLALALLLSLPALFLNPIGIRQILYPFDTLLHQPLNLSSVAEWAPLDMTDARGIALLAVLLCCFLLAVTRQADIYFDELLLLALGTYLAVSHMRMLAVFGILAAPILSRQLSNSWEGYNVEEDRIWPNALVLGAITLAVYLSFPSQRNLQSQVEDQSPVKAVEFLHAHPLSGPMLNDYQSGGYLIWAAPEHPVFIDGRADIYEWSGLLGEFGSWATLSSDPNLLLQKYKIAFCLLDRQAPIARVLPLLPQWKTVYGDEHTVIFARNTQY